MIELISQLPVVCRVILLAVSLFALMALMGAQRMRQQLALMALVDERRAKQKRRTKQRELDDLYQEIARLESVVEDSLLEREDREWLFQATE
jgi:thiamine biosynthesis lipoprotein ApbE